MRWNRKVLAYIAVGIAAVLLIYLAYVLITHPEESRQLIRRFGYLGVFVAVLATNLSLFIGIPTPTYIILAVAMGLDPIVTTIVAALGSAIGESSGYFIGIGGKKLIERKYGKSFREWRNLLKKYGFLTIVAIAALPFPPDDFAGILAGAMGYNYWMFLAATFVGKLIKYGTTAALTITGIRVFNRVFYD